MSYNISDIKKGIVYVASSTGNNLNFIPSHYPII